jgi:hypothetical protein
MHFPIERSEGTRDKDHMATQSIRMAFALVLLLMVAGRALEQEAANKPEASTSVSVHTSGSESKPGQAASRQPFDFDGDGDVDGSDYAHLDSCFTGPTGPPTSGCIDADFDRDGLVNQTDLFWFQRCLSGANVPARPTCALGATRLPPRTAEAPKGKDFLVGVKDIEKADRDKKILEQVLSGNFPDFLRRFVPVTVSMTIDGAVHTATYEVMPDVLAIGPDADYCRIPMMPQTAQVIADAFGCSLPTRKMSDDIYAAAHVKLAPHPFTPIRYKIEAPTTFFQSNRAIDEARVEAKAPLGAFLGGIKKDVVISNALLDAPGKVAIYGWHQLDGKPIQPLYVGHVNTWVDYSHGIRLVKKLMQVDGRPMLIGDVLADPVLCQLLSDEGPMPDPRYH